MMTTSAVISACAARLDFDSGMVSVRLLIGVFQFFLDA